MSIEKEFVPYQESLELKELGFGKSCFGEYRQWDGSEPYLKLYQDLDGCSTDPADYEYTTECLAPTFSQAFRWFREKYKSKFILSEDYYWIIGIGQTTAKSYEEAELACLRKLIEIVKQKQ